MRTISPEEFVAMQQTAKTLIECIFQEEDSFVKELINESDSWETDSYELDSVTISGYIVLIVIRFDDFSEKIIRIVLGDVYNWYDKLCEEKGL